jgi:hypothetical protein
LNLGSAVIGELSSVKLNRIPNWKGWAGEELGGKDAVKNLFTEPSHLSLYQHFRPRTELFSLIFIATPTPWLGLRKLTDTSIVFLDLSLATGYRE